MQLCSTTVCSSVIKIMALGLGALSTNAAQPPRNCMLVGESPLLPVFYLLILKALLT